MITTDDIAIQVLAAINQYIGISPSDVTPATYGDICEAIMGVPNVASVGLSFDKATGAVGARVEDIDGKFSIVSITEPYANATVSQLTSRVASLEATVADLEGRLRTSEFERTMLKGRFEGLRSGWQPHAIGGLTDAIANKTV